MKKYLQLLLKPPITRDFKRKLHHNFHTLTPGEMVLYLLFIRPFWNKERRFFFDGSFGLLGQMYAAERKALYDTIVNHKPRQCYEIGTYTGGGSTYFLTSAFAKIGHGELISMESTEYYYTKATNYFKNRLPKLNRHVKFIHSSKPDAFIVHFPSDGNVDCVFFDGAEDGKQTLEQFRFFEPYFKAGSVIIFHDWNTEKTIDVKPVLTNNSDWELVQELTPPDSIGLAVFKHR